MNTCMTYTLYTGTKRIQNEMQEIGHLSRSSLGITRKKRTIHLHMKYLKSEYWILPYQETLCTSHPTRKREPYVTASTNSVQFVSDQSLVGGWHTCRSFSDQPSRSLEEPRRKPQTVHTTRVVNSTHRPRRPACCMLNYIQGLGSIQTYTPLNNIFS
jgi:hypothetical protein